MVTMLFYGNTRNEVTSKSHCGREADDSQMGKLTPEAYIYSISLEVQHSTHPHTPAM